MRYLYWCCLATSLLLRIRNLSEMAVGSVHTNTDAEEPAQACYKSSKTCKTTLKFLTVKLL